MCKKIYGFIAVLFTSLLLTGCNAENAFKEITSTTEKELVSIQVTPTTVKTKGVSDLTVMTGLTQSFMAMGTYMDGTHEDISHLVTWKSSNVVVATMSGKVLTALTDGNTQVSASQKGVSSNALDVNVVTATLRAIQVTPADPTIIKGNDLQFTAMGTYSNNMTVDISSSVVWTPSDTNVVTVTAAGLATGVIEGTITVTASKDSIESNIINVTVTSPVLRTIQVTPADPTIIKGNDLQFTAMGTYSDNTTVDISSSVAWMPSDTNVVTITATGLASGVTEGTTTVTASKDSIESNTINVTVSTLRYCHQWPEVLNLNCLPYIDISLDTMYRFTAPPSQEWLDAQRELGNNYLSPDTVTDPNLVPNRPAGVFVKYTFSGTRTFCSQLGASEYLGSNSWRQPTIQELDALWMHDSFEISFFDRYGWPSDLPSWSMTEYDIDTGDWQENNDRNAYVKSLSIGSTSFERSYTWSHPNMPPPTNMPSTYPICVSQQ